MRTPYTITHNDNYNSLEVTFAVMPSARLRCELKTRGFRWHSMNHFWYGKTDENELRELLENEYNPAPESQPETVNQPTTEPAQAEPLDRNTAITLAAELDALRKMLAENRAENYFALEKLDGIIGIVREDIGKTAAAKTGTTSIRTAVKRILKSAQTSHAAALHYPAYRDGKQIFCDDYRLVSLNTPLDGFTERPDSIPAMSENTLDQFTRIPDDLEPLELPALAELKTHIKTKTAEYKAAHGTTKKMPPVEYDFGANLPYVNAAYLADMLEALPNCTAYTSPSRRYTVFFKAENGTGLLMEIHRPKTKTETAA